MDIKDMTLNELKGKGYMALRKELGVVGFIRFLGMFSLGSGNYVEDRKDILNKYDVNEIVKEIKEARDEK